MWSIINSASSRNEILKEKIDTPDGINKHIIHTTFSLSLLLQS